MRKLVGFILRCAMILGFAPLSFAATQVDALIEKLVEKGF